MSQLPSSFRRLAVAALAVAALVAPFLAPPASRAQAPEAPAADAAPLTIGRVFVTGNHHTDSLRILRTFDVAPGSKYSADAVRRGTRKLLALGLFSDARVLAGKPHDGLVDLNVVVVERPRLGSVVFHGNVKRETSDLEKKLFLRPGETYSVSLVQTQVDSLLQYYRDEGFPRAKVTPKVDTLATGQGLGLTFEIEEGEKLRITVIRFEGADAFSPGRLRKALKTKQKGFFGGGDLKDESFAEDREKLEEFYHDHGYRDMSVDDITTAPGAEPRALTMTVKVHEGPLYRFGDVTWSGNKVVPTATLQKLWTLRKGATYSKSKLDKVVGNVYGEYAEHGYLYLGVEPQEAPRDSVVDIAFEVSEGAPSHVRLVSIIGNKGTREHVIRRELDVHEGDLFRRSSLMRSRDNLMRLGLFEEANPDFRNLDSSDVELIFKVKEKQVGTASAGAGYTGSTGLTGFLELGHNNVLGNGQQLSLHLERGNKIENYSLSFTEPWFHDAPTLLGFSAYNLTTIYNEFDERRRGGSARIGRPLPWPDYSRGSLSYTLEKVRISNVRDSISLVGVPVNKDQITSAFETNFVRNSADHPMYPSRGTRLTLNDAFTGGPFLGDVNYHVHRLEGRVWFKSPIPRMTTMLRMRVGAVAQYPWKDGAIPDYARFRLGGGSTLDPLRGYMDYQVVPPKFISKVWVYSSTVIRNAANTADSITVRDSSLTTRRYPGGKYLELFTAEQQFPIVHPLHGVIFFDAGNVWDYGQDIKPLQLKCGAGIGFRMEIPILGNVGFDYGYGFNRDDGPKWQGHFLLGNVGF